MQTLAELKGLQVDARNECSKALAEYNREGTQKNAKKWVVLANDSLEIFETIKCIENWILVCLLVAVMFLAGCSNTIKGAARDTSKFFNSIDRAIVEQEEQKGEQK